MLYAPTFALLLTASTPELTQEPPQVVVLVSLAETTPDEAFAEAEQRAERELVAAGYSVQFVHSRAISPAARIAELRVLAAENGAAAAVLIARIPDNGAIELTVEDRLTGKTSLRRLRPERRGALSPSLVALRLVELLNASTLELTLGARSSGLRSDNDASIPVVPSPDPDTHRGEWRLGLGVTGLDPKGRLGPCVGAALTTRGPILARAGLHGRVLVALAPQAQELQRDPGRARIDLVFAALGVDVVPFAAGRLAPHAGVEVLALGAIAHGEAPSPLAARSVFGTTVVGAATAGISLRLSPDLVLSLDAALGAPTRELRIVFGDERVAAARGPVARATLGIEVSL